MIKKALNRFKYNKYIKIIENSPYFDKEYYLSKNLDVKISGINPAAHYYYDGWKDGRNPSTKFDNDRYFKCNEISKDINPIIHYELYGKKSNFIVTSVGEPLMVKEVINEYFNESTPLKIINVDNLKNRRLNIIFNGFNSSCFFGGKATALILAIKYVNKYHYDLRIISQNPETKIFKKFLELFNIDCKENVSFFSTDSNQLLELDEKDDFLCTMWSNADSVLNTKYVRGKIFYIMQEVETFFYDHGDYHLRCLTTLTNNRIIPIVNSKLLYDYFCKNGYSNVKNNGIYFEPVFSKELLKPSKESFKKKKKHNLFFYARPTHQRNLFYFCLEVLNDAFKYGMLDENEWVIYTAGDKSMPKFRLDNSVEIRQLGILNWGNYCDFMSTVDLCFSVIYTPHPSYPPLDAVTSGAVAVTNKYENKKDLTNYSKNIITSDLNKDSMLEALKEGASLAKNIEEREKNFKKTTTIGNWDDAFSEVIKFMHDKLEE